MMKVLSLFDGMSCGKIALQRARIPVSQYYASEIDKYAIAVSRLNHPEIIQLGDVRVVRQMAQAGIFGHIDLLIAGSPCQGFSFAGKHLAFNDPRSALFFEYVWILQALKQHNPNIKFLLENVKMKKEHLAVITQILSVLPVFINSNLVSAQNRQRYYWANWSFGQPQDKGIFLKDIIETGKVDREKSLCIDANYYKGGSLKNYLNKSRRQNYLSPTKLINVHPSGRGMNGWIYDQKGKAPALTTNKGEGSKVAFHSDEKRLMVREISGISKNQNGFRPYRGDKRKSSLSEIGTITESEFKSQAMLTTHPPSTNLAGDIEHGISYRKLTPVECERLQTVPDNYTGSVSNTQRYKMLGNGWTIDVIAHIFRSMPL